MAAQVGLVGLAVMGANLVLNLESRGFKVAVYNRTTKRTDEFLDGPARGKGITGARTLEEFVSSLEHPRRIILMVQAGNPVDSMIDQLLPLLDKGDVIMDGGNSLFRDTIRRSATLQAAGFNFFGVGISGGEEGALHGPSIMPGGPQLAYEAHLAPLLNAIAAKVSDGPCCTYIGPGGAGHYVKMTHNGIEYGDMQLIAEAYAILTHVLGIPPAELSAIFSNWNTGELDSYLIEITSKVLAFVDPDTGKPLVDLILDKAGQKGTGRWTSQEALELGIPIPTIDAAVWARNISAFKDERVVASKLLSVGGLGSDADASRLIESVRQALYAAKIASYAQGMAMLRAASAEHQFNLNLAEIARIWKGGCIIRARLLNEIQRAFTHDPDLPNLLVDGQFRESLASSHQGWRYAVRVALEAGVPVPALSASLAYFDSYRAERLPANLIQGQRDFFGAHTYQRIDKPGTFHTQWEG